MNSATTSQIHLSRGANSWRVPNIVNTVRVDRHSGGDQLEWFYVINHNVARVQGSPLINRRRGVHDFQIQLSSLSLVHIASVQALYVNALSLPLNLEVNCCYRRRHKIKKNSYHMYQSYI